jgi:hypothetical protein
MCFCQTNLPYFNSFQLYSGRSSRTHRGRRQLCSSGSAGPPDRVHVQRRKGSHRSARQRHRVNVQANKRFEVKLVRWLLRDKVM